MSSINNKRRSKNVGSKSVRTTKRSSVFNEYNQIESLNPNEIYTKYSCKHCKWITARNATRMLLHTAAKCTKTPIEIRNEYKNFLIRNKAFIKKMRLNRFADDTDNHYEQYNDSYVDAKENDDNFKSDLISRNSNVHVQLIGNQSKNLNNFQIEYIDENEIELDVDGMKNDPINISKNNNNVQSGNMEDSNFIDVAPSIEIDDEENDTEQSIVFQNQSNTHKKLQMQSPPPPNDDEYQLFGLYVASQLRKLPLRRAESSKCHITEFLSQERIGSIENTN